MNKVLKRGTSMYSGSAPLVIPYRAGGTTRHNPTNPDPVKLPSEVKRTCKYPVDDVYSLFELKEFPDTCAICSVMLHDEDAHRSIVTWSQHSSVLKEVKERWITPAELMSHLQ